MAPPGLPSGFGPPSSAAVPMPAPPPAFQGPAPGTRKLVAVYEGQTFPVETPRFTIGRSKANSLPIRDGNVSREHAIVELVGGDHYIVDNASTNGVEFREQRITRKAIQDGDVFVIGGHSIEFRFQS